MYSPLLFPLPLDIICVHQVGLLYQLNMKMWKNVDHEKPSPPIYVGSIDFVLKVKGVKNNGLTIQATKSISPLVSATPLKQRPHMFRNRWEAWILSYNTWNKVNFVRKKQRKGAGGRLAMVGARRSPTPNATQFLMGDQAGESPLNWLRPLGIEA